MNNPPRYFRIQGESQHYDDWGGDPTYWFEINDQGDANRQIEEYPNGNILSYDSLHSEDDFGGLCVMVVELGDSFWNEYEISKTEFENGWEAHIPLNRKLERKKTPE